MKNTKGMAFAVLATEMKTVRKNWMLAILIIFGLSVLPACKPNDPIKVKAPKIKKYQPTGISGFEYDIPEINLPDLENLPDGSTPEGTSDSGGCNGVGSKCFESYSKIIATHSAYENVLAPLFENIIDEDDVTQEDKESTLFNYWAFTKTWYIAPVDLKTISNDVLGVSFFKNTTQQLAIQTDKEIWIDQRHFDQMDQQAQADLILHEIIMTMYLSKFIPWADICNLNKTLVEKDEFNSTKNDSENSAEAKDENVKEISCDDEIYQQDIFKSEAKRPLTDEDYENIRNAVVWIKQHATSPVSMERFDSVLAHNKFDKRFFKSTYHESLNFEDHSDIYLEWEKLKEIIEGSKASGYFPDNCKFVDSKEDHSCSISAEAKFLDGLVKLTNHSFTYSYKGIEIQISSDNGFQKNVKLSIGEGSYLTVNKSEKRTLYFLHTTEARDEYAIGDTYYQGMLVFEPGEDGPTETRQMKLLNILLFPGVITSVDINNEEGDICLGKKPFVSTISDNRVFAKGPTGLDPELLSSIIVNEPRVSCTSPTPSIEQ